jgi:translocation and assembly module TamB
MTRRRKLVLLAIPLSLVLVLVVLLYSGWGLALSLRIAAAVLPGQLSIDDQQGSLLGPVQLQGLRYRDDQVGVSIQQLDLDWRLLALVSGKLALTRLDAKGVDITIPAQAQAQGTKPVRMVLPLAIDIQQASVSKLVIRTKMRKAPLVIDKLTLSGHTSAQTIKLRSFTLAAYHAQARVAGTIKLSELLPLDLTLEASYQLDAKRQLRASGKLSGDLRKLRLSQTLSGLVQAKLAAEAKDIRTHLHWTSQLDISQLDLHKLLLKSPAVAVQGEVKGSGDLNVVHIDSQLHLYSKRIGLAQVHIKGDSDLRLTDYRLTTQADFTGVDLPPAKLSLQARGNRQHVNVTQLSVHSLKGEVTGHARVNWQPQLAVSADLAMQGLHTGLLARQWPGQLSGELSLHSETVVKNPLFHFSLRKLTGELRGYPLRAAITGSWTPAQLALDKLQLDIGGTKVTAHGSLAQRWDLNVHAQSDNLNAVLPHAKGRFDLDATLSGTATAPRLIIKGKANQLAYAQNEIDSLAVNMDLGLAQQARAFIDIQAQEVQARSGHWNSVHLRSDGSNAAHGITLDAINDKASLHARLHGEFTPWRWQGRLEQFSFTQAHYGKWQLQQAVNIVLAKAHYRVSKLCLVQNGSHLCGQGQWDAKQRYARADARAMPLLLLQPWLPQNIQLTGQLDMQAHLNVTAQNEVKAKLSVHAPANSVVVHFVEINEQLTLGTGTLTAELDKQGLRGNLHLPLREGGGIDSELNLPGWTWQSGLPRSQVIAASLKLDRIPADVITRFIPDMARAQGQLHADFKINGSLGEPRLRGSARWRDGSVLIPQVGIQIREVSAEVKSVQTNTVEFVVKARSGDGDVQLQGRTRLIPDQGWPTTVTLTSHNLEVSNIAEAYILVDSQVQIRLQGSTINVDGDITVPRARLRPHTLPEGAVPVSPDVVIVHGEKAATPPTHWLLTSHLRVQLGDRVDFDGFGIRGKLRGTLRINDEPGKLALGQGEISIVDGSYRLRGQDLTIRRGRLLYTNTFIDDPALDVVTAGVRLKGTLKQPQLSVFSEPAMSESDALAYLILGHPLSQSTTAEGQSVDKAASALGLFAGDYLAKGLSGQLGLDELRVDVSQTTQNTSLVMGKYLSPKLYLRYYTGIAESSRIVQLQYQLSRRLQIQTESGYRGSQSITGGDIFFTIEY